MANISAELAAIMSAIYGQQVRSSIHGAIKKINDVSEVVLTIGTEVDSPTSSTEGFYDGSLYINEETSDLWKCTGSNWKKIGTLRGVPGENGNKWYRGSLVSADNLTADIEANVNDNYLNTSEGKIYHCISGGNPSTWVFDMTLSGGGGGASDWSELSNKPFNTVGSDLKTEGNELALSNKVTEKLVNLDSNGKIDYSKVKGTPTIPTITDTYSATSSDGMSGKAVASAISEKANKTLIAEPYRDTKAYSMGDIVQDGIKVYEAIQDSIPVGTPLSNATYWKPYDSLGDKVTEGGEWIDITDAFVADTTKCTIRGIGVKYNPMSKLVVGYISFFPTVVNSWVRYITIDSQYSPIENSPFVTIDSNNKAYQSWVSAPESNIMVLTNEGTTGIEHMGSFTYIAK